MGCWKSPGRRWLLQVQLKNLDEWQRKRDQLSLQCQEAWACWRSTNARVGSAAKQVLQTSSVAGSRRESILMHHVMACKAVESQC